MNRRALIPIAVLALTAFTAAAQSAGTPDTKSGDQSAASQEAFPLSFGFGIGIGVSNFPNEDYVPGGTAPEYTTYQRLSLAPEFRIGKFGVGFDFTVNFRFTGGDQGNEFEVREQDWKVGTFQEFVDVYLPKINYLFYGAKGDPFFVKMGTITDAVLGNGFILGGYSNALYRPETRLFGMSLDVDGSLFGTPIVGVETFAANLSRFDVMAARLYVRPLSGSELPILDKLQIGGTVAVDRDPGYFVKRNATYTGFVPNSSDTVQIYGGDFRLPLLSGDLVSLATFGDVVVQKEGTGEMIGAGGRLAKIVTFGGQLRFLGDNFIPTYFDNTYDSQRVERYLVYDGTATKKGGMGWLASLGFSVLEDKVVFNTTMEGPLGEIEGNYWDWGAVFMVKEGVLPGFFFDVGYTKKNMAGFDDFKRWRENALIQANVNYKTGPAVISLGYTLKYDPANPDGWTVTTNLESRISF